MVRDRTPGSMVFDTFNVILLTSLALICLLPLVHLVAISFSGRWPSEAYQVGLFPIDFTTANYERIFRFGQFQRSFMISVVRTVLGTAVNIVLTALMAYPLSLEEGFKGQRLAKWLLIFGLIFSGGLIPNYLAVRNFGLLDTIWALIIPSAVSIWNVIILMNFFRGLPRELAEAASIDGASHWSILFNIYLPLSLPALATLTLFAAVGHWNAWFDGMLYIRTMANVPLQTYLKTLIVDNNFQGLRVATAGIFEQISQRSLRAAQVVISIVPILMLYPFLQRYFIHGLTLGSLKE